MTDLTDPARYIGGTVMAAPPPVFEFGAEELQRYVSHRAAVMATTAEISLRHEIRAIGAKNRLGPAERDRIAKKLRTVWGAS